MFGAKFNRLVGITAGNDVSFSSRLSWFDHETLFYNTA